MFIVLMLLNVQTNKTDCQLAQVVIVTLFRFWLSRKHFYLVVTKTFLIILTISDKLLVTKGCITALMGMAVRVVSTDFCEILSVVGCQLKRLLMVSSLLLLFPSRNRENLISSLGGRVRMKVEAEMFQSRNQMLLISSF